MHVSLRQRASWRFYFRHPWQLWLSLLSIALGTAVVVAVDLANHSARQAFSLSLDTLTGRATHQIVAGSAGIDEQLYRQLRIDWGFRQSAPVVEGQVVAGHHLFTLLGIEPFAEPMFRQTTAAISRGELRTLLTTPGAVAMSDVRAQQLGLKPGDSLPLQHEGLRETAHLAATFNASDSTQLDWLVADIAVAQTLLGQTGRLDRVDLILQPEAAVRLAGLLPDSVRLQPASARQGALTQMTAAFHLNLSALSLLALVVGGFLVYNTMTFAVLQRRSQFAVQRMLGVTGAQLFRLVLLEALLFGLLAGTAGVLLGVLLGQGLLRLVTRTINDLYFTLSVTQLTLDPLLLAKGLAVALVATALAALGPAAEAARTAPVSVLRQSRLELQARRYLPLIAAAGGLLAVVGLGVTRFAGDSLLAGFAALFLLIIGYSLAVPYVAGNLVLRVAAMLPVSSLWWQFAIRGVQAGLSRTGLAIAALAVAISATVGVGIMISSFRASVDDWLGLTLQSDVFVSAADSDTLQGDASIAPQLLERLGQLPGVAAWSAGFTTELDVRGVPVHTLVLQPGAHSQAGFDVVDGDAGKAWQAFLQGAVLVSEPLAYHQKLQRGDTVDLFTRLQGKVAVPVAGVFRDYSSSNGMLVMSRDAYASRWPLRDFATLGLKLESEEAEAPLMTAARRAIAEEGAALQIIATREIRERSLAIFDRTFAITHVLRLLAIVVAFVGVFSALMALIMERRRDYAVYRAVGMTPGQLQGIILSQSLVVGVLAGLLALPLGWLMSEMLIQVINQRAFGWSMSRQLPWQDFSGAVLLSVIAAGLAGLWPAISLRRMVIAQSLREA